MLRARDLYYFVRVSNLASRPLRELEGDFGRLSKMGKDAAASIERLDAAQAKLASRRVSQLTAYQARIPGGAKYEQMIASQTARVNANLEKQRINLSNIAREDSRIIALNRTQFDINSRILRVQQEQQLIARRMKMVQAAPLTAAEKAPIVQNLQQRQVFSQRRMVSAQAALGENADKIAAANTNIANQTRLLERNRAVAAGMPAVFAAETAAMDQAAAKQLRDLEITDTAIRQNRDEYTRLAEAQRRLQWDHISRMGRALSDLGRTAQYAGGIVVGALGIMAYQAAKFSTEVTLAATQITSNVKQIPALTSQLQAGIIAQMQRFPSTAKDMTRSLYDIHSALNLTGTGANRVRQALGILNVMNRAAVAGQAPLNDVTAAGITIMNDFGKSATRAGTGVKALTRLMNIAFAAVRFGRIHFSDFTQQIGTLAPAAKANNQTFKEMAGAFAFGTRVLGNASKAAIGYARLLDVLQRSAAAGGFRKFGIEVDNAKGKLLPLSNIIGQMVEKIPGLASGRTNIIQFFKQLTAGTGTSGLQGTIQARRFFTFLIHDHQLYQEVIKRSRTDTNEFQKSWKALGQTPGVRFGVFINQLKSLALVIGQDATPALEKMFRPIAHAVHWFNSLSNSTKQTITTFAAWGGLGLLIGGTAAVIIGSITRMFITFRTLGKTLFAARTELTAVGVAGEAGAASLSAVFGMLAVVGIPAIILFHKQIGTVLKDLGLNGMHGVVLALVGIMALKFIPVIVKAGTAMMAFGNKALIAFGMVETGAAEAAGASEILGGVTIAGMGLATAVPVIGAAIAVLAGGLYILHQHAEDAKKRIKEMTDAINAARKASQRPITIAVRIGNYAQLYREHRQAVRQLPQITQRIQTQQAQLAATPQSDFTRRLALERSINELTFRRQQLQRRTANLAGEIGRTESSVPRFLHDQAFNMDRIRKAQERINILRRIERIDMASANQSGSFTVKQIERLKNLIKDVNLSSIYSDPTNAIKTTTTNLRQYSAAAQEASAKFGRSFQTFLQGFVRLGMLKGPITPRIAFDMAKFVTDVHHKMLSLKEMQMFINAEVDPSFRRRIPAEMRRFINSQKRLYKIFITVEPIIRGIREFKFDPKVGIFKNLGNLFDSITKSVLRTKKALHEATDTKTTQLHVRSVQEWIRLATQAYRVARLHPQNTQDQIRLEKILADIKKKYQGAELKGIMDVIKADDAATKKKIDNAKKTAAQVAQAATAMVDAFNNIKQQEQSAFGDLFSGPYIQSAAVQNRLDWGQVLRPQDLTRDLKSQIGAFTSWNNDLNKLRRRGAPAALLAQLLQMGPAAAKNVHLLTQMNRRQLGQYFGLFQQAQKDIQRQSMIQFMGQLKDWRKYGRRAALQFMMGISDNHSFINREMRRIFLNFLRTGQVSAGHVGRAHTTTHHTTHHHYDNRTTINAHGVDVGTAVRKAKTHTRRRHRRPGSP